MDWKRFNESWERAYLKWQDVKAVIIVIVALLAIGAFVWERVVR